MATLERARPRAKRAMPPPPALIASGDDLAVPALRFIAHCLRSWVDAGASPTRFLSTWIPVPMPGSPLTAAPRLGRPRAASRPVRQHLTAAAPRRGGDTAQRIPAHRSGNVAFRTHYPYVAALLRELGILGRDPASSQRPTPRRTAR